jgi:hypothetical protein
MSTADKVIVFAVKAFGSFGLAASAVRSTFILAPYGWHLSACVLTGAVATLCIIWGWFK